jgi:hypothetical protein
MLVDSNEFKTTSWVHLINKQKHSWPKQVGLFHFIINTKMEFIYSGLIEQQLYIVEEHASYGARSIIASL